MFLTESHFLATITVLIFLIPVFRVLSILIDNALLFLHPSIIDLNDECVTAGQLDYQHAIKFFDQLVLLLVSALDSSLTPAG